MYAKARDGGVRGGGGGLGLGWEGGREVVEKRVAVWDRVDVWDRVILANGKKLFWPLASAPV